MAKIKINHVTENADGTKVVFQGTLEGPELAFVLEFGITSLMREGALPFVSKQTFDPAQHIMDMPEAEQ